MWRQRSWSGPMRAHTEEKVLISALVLVLAAIAVTFSPLRIISARGDSMTPAIPARSVLAALPVRADQVHVGDVVVFARPDAAGGTIVHRVVELTARSGAIIAR